MKKVKVFTLDGIEITAKRLRDITKNLRGIKLYFPKLPDKKRFKILW